MLQITIPKTEMWNESSNEFIETKSRVLALEHSLVSIAKWESKWCKPFLTNKKKEPLEMLDYIKCMTLTQNVPDVVYNQFSNENLNDINKYIESPMTATTVRSLKSNGYGEQVTAELIYYWMIALHIPFECQKWHLNRLLMLIRVCNIKNQPPKKHSANELRARNASINAARKKRWNTKG